MFLYTENAHNLRMAIPSTVQYSYLPYKFSEWKEGCRYCWVISQIVDYPSNGRCRLSEVTLTIHCHHDVFLY